jgi:phosphate transport system substrate-binding protein
VNKLTLEQLGKIFKGDITNWKEVGGPDAKISLYGRQSNSGTYVFFREFVVKGDYSPHK